MHRSFDIIIIGGGHSGSEAANAAARLGLQTLLLTNSIDGIATMPCNPAIGGPAKSHLVKEIDALGGIMGLAADATYIQMKTLNLSKGPAVRSLRAQSDKREYSAWVRQYLEQLPNLTIYQSSAKRILIDDKTNQAIGVETNLEEVIYAKSVILTAGTFLEGRIFSGNKFETAGRQCEKASLGLSPKLKDLGLKTGRLKTGTPPRLDRRTIDFSNLEEAPGDTVHDWFSFLPNRPIRPQHLCHITRTNSQTHDIIHANLHLSPMYSGEVEASGPRYCPSIEDKVVRFSHNPSHHFFLEPEGLSSNEIYLQGCSTSLPIEVQWQIVQSLPGCKDAVITRPAYAVEYDYFPGIQFKHNLESKQINGLFVAGQVLGTSGYEEAAAQGIIAGINAAIHVTKQHPELQVSERLKSYTKQHESFILNRSNSYIGTLIDDLVSKEIKDPYRILTSRSEYRLLLRQDNADQRLTEIGRELGLVDDYRWQVFCTKQEKMQRERTFINRVKIATDKCAPELIGIKDNERITLKDFLKKHEVSHDQLNLQELIDNDDPQIDRFEVRDIYENGLEYGFEIETEIKYQGYIERQKKQILDMQKFDQIRIPSSFDFKACKQISLEARDKLTLVNPQTLAQASRIGGVTPNDLAVLSVIFNPRKSTATT